jgi:hypothetical protein
MQSFRISALVLTFMATLGLAFSPGVAQAQNNSAVQQQGGSGLAGMLSSLKDRQPYKMQTIKVKTMDEILAEAQRQNEINVAAQFKIDQTEREKRFEKIVAAHEADLAQRKTAIQSAQKSTQQQGGVNGDVNNVLAPDAADAKNEVKPQIRVYVRKKDEPEKPRRLFNVREQ